MVPRSLLAGALSVVASLAAAQVPAGGEFRVNTFTTGPQFAPHADAADGGDFVVVWQALAGFPATYDVFAQRYAASGQPVGAEFRVNSYTTGLEREPRVAVNRDGSFVVVWTNRGTQAHNGVWVQRHDPAGIAVGAPLRVDTGGASTASGLAADARGNFVVAWSGAQAQDSVGVFARRVSAQGSLLGDPFLVNTYVTSDQTFPAVAMTPAGDFVVVWNSLGQDGSEYGVFGQMFDAGGGRVGGEFRVNTMTVSRQSLPSVARDATGDFVVAWGSNYQDGSLYGVFAQRFTSSGARLGGEFRVNTYTTGSQTTVGVAAGEAGAFVVTWAGHLQDGSLFGAFAQRFSRDGARRGAEFRVNTYTPSDQVPRGLAHDAVGNFTVAWQSNFQDGSADGIYAQRFGGLSPVALRVDTSANGVLEPGETVDVRPSWRNQNGATQAFGGAVSGFTGPAGLTYTITDNSSVYGSVADGATRECTDCYVVSVSDPPARPQTHIDASALESIVPDAQGQQKRWLLHVGESFTDVPPASSFYRFVETLLHHGVTGGCGPDLYCPASPTSRAQMAVFVLVAKEGAAYVPAACTTPVFADVPASSPFCRWIEELARRGVVGGCGGGNYCPSTSVTREQMAVFVLRTLDPALSPPACVAPNLFADVPETSPYCRWVEELANRGIVTGCGGGNYCPASPVTREQMGVFISATFALTLYGP